MPSFLSSLSITQLSNTATVCKATSLVFKSTLSTTFSCLYLSPILAEGVSAEELPSKWRRRRNGRWWSRSQKEEKSQGREPNRRPFVGQESSVQRMSQYLSLCCMVDNIYMILPEFLCLSVNIVLFCLFFFIPYRSEACFVSFLCSCEWSFNLGQRR